MNLYQLHNKPEELIGYDILGSDIEFAKFWIKNIYYPGNINALVNLVNNDDRWRSEWPAFDSSMEFDYGSWIDEINDILIDEYGEEDTEYYSGLMGLLKNNPELQRMIDNKVMEI